MQHLDFILWMVLFPISISVVNYIDVLRDKKVGKLKEYSEDVQAMSAITVILIWVIVGYNLF